MEKSVFWIRMQKDPNLLEGSRSRSKYGSVPDAEPKGSKGKIYAVKLDFLCFENKILFESL
jgi:hypothetical protein